MKRVARAFGRWYFRGMLKNRCLCRLRLRRLCFWIEDRYVFPRGEKSERLFGDLPDVADRGSAASD